MPNWSFIGSLVLPNFGGWASSLSMRGQLNRPDGNAWYQTIKKPEWDTPNRWFEYVLYTSMGYASYIVVKECGGLTDKAVVPLSLYGSQLVLNWTWAPVFFGCHKIGLAACHLVALDIAATACTISFYTVNKKTVFFMLPYLFCLGFATVFNYKTWQMNREEKKEESKK